jgi:hypothetical protein
MPRLGFFLHVPTVRPVLDQRTHIQSLAVLVLNERDSLQAALASTISQETYNASLAGKRQNLRAYALK